jgi:plasmid stability protein
MTATSPSYCYQILVSAIIEEVKQIITRVDDEVAEALKCQARRSGESVNAYMNRLLRVVVGDLSSSRQMWKAAAVADGRLMERGPQAGRTRLPRDLSLKTVVSTPAGYASRVVSEERDES